MIIVLIVLIKWKIAHNIEKKKTKLHDHKHNT